MLFNMNQLIEWSETKDGAGNSIWKSGPKTEYLIYMDTYFWILTYVDFWTVSDDAFITNIKRHHSDPWAVNELKKFAEAVHVKYLEHKNREI